MPAGRSFLFLPLLEMSLALQRRKVDAGDAGHRDIVQRQVSHQPDLDDAVVVLDAAQIGAVPINLKAELGASPGVGELDMNVTQGDAFLEGLARAKKPESEYPDLVARACTVVRLRFIIPIACAARSDSRMECGERTCALGQTDLDDVGRSLKRAVNQSSFLCG